MTNNGSDRARFGPFEVDLHTHELWKFGTRLRLVGQPFEILAVLLSRPGELVTREELRNRLWPSDTFVDFNHGLNAAVNKLREALSDSAENPRYIETLPRRGYRFIAKVEWLAERPAAIAVSPVPPDLPNPPGIPAPAASSPAFHPATEHPAADEFPLGSLPRYLTGAGVIFTILLAIALVIRTGSNSKAGASASVERTRPLMSISDTAGPAFSADGTSVAFFRERSEGSEAGIYATAVDSDRLIQLTNNEDDCCPVWSPDGRWVAFTRVHDHEYSIYLIPSDGGGEQKQKAEKILTQSAAFTITPIGPLEHKLDTGSIMAHHGEIDWSPDGQSIVFAGPSGLYTVRLDNSAVNRITAPPLGVDDWGPTFSPDGKSVMFVRTHQVGAPDEIWTVPAPGGEGTRRLSERGRIDSPPQWSFDGHSVIYSSNRTGHPALWRASLEAPDEALPINEAGSFAWDPAVSRRGYRFVYERLLRNLSIWQMDLNDSGPKHAYLLVPSTSDTDQGPGPQFSPDGQKLAYMSDRSGTMEIWISNRDGSNPYQLSAVGGAGTPRWSPDSQTVAFDASTPNGSKIVAMNVHGGAPVILTPDNFHSVCPSWSRDGRWVYLGSPRSGDWQVWKVPAAGGSPMQVTYHGGQAALESLDGKYLYYAKSPAPEPEIWRVPMDGGEETPLPLVHPGTWASWQVVRGGILFVGPSLGHQAVLSFFDFAKERTTTVAILDRTPFWLGATPDGSAVAFDQPGREHDQAMLVENFR
ncbi:MAG TPA: winged helix-turn-helix domain-containing protein [Verrucomicrobiae bacterium]|nr:winged helix-turn-helix domain-containing protein [Verrucomicrobiae bacterium]